MDLPGGPTFEDLSIDDELTQLERVVRYSSSSIALQRLVHVKMLAETVAAVGFEQTVKCVVPLLAPLAADQEQVVRQHLGEQLDEIARLCKSMGKEAGYRLIIETVLPTLTKLLGDNQAEVRQAAGESLVGVAGLMKPMDLGQHVLTIVLELAHDDEQEELRMTAAALLNDLAESLGNDLCKQFVTPEMVSLSEDPNFRVRKATALNLHKICKVVGEAGIQRLLPAYIRLTTDEVYRVRKACTEALVEMSKAVGPEVSLRELQPVFVRLASEDASKLVRTGALQHLGRLISTLPGECVTENLVQYFTATAIESMGDPVADAELRLYCAFSFPAVVLTIGPARWGELRDSFGVLLRDPSWSVRKTLSHSLHEVAKVLTASDVEEDLVPAMEAFLRDMEDVRLGVIRHLADFFEQMSPDRREKHLNVLVEILQTTSPFNWRLREILAQQLPHLAPLLSLDSVFFAVVPVAFGLLNDPVAVVRERTFEVVAPLLQLAGAHSGARQASMVSRVRELAHAHTYQARQMYVYICHSMAIVGSPQDRRLYVQEFVPSLAELARDGVVNVRIAMSRTLSKSPDWMMELPDIRRAIHHLVRDGNPDVRHFVSFLPPILGSELSQEDKVPCVDTSSVMSDESVLTQWSVSTQRSMLSVGDFPLIKDVNSPSRSLKVGRQRSSSMESGGGESGYSTTSSEGDALNRQSSRRLPLPSGWGLGGGISPSSSPVTAPSILGAARAAAGASGAPGSSPPRVDEVDEPTTADVTEGEVTDSGLVSGDGASAAVADAGASKVDDDSSIQKRAQGRNREVGVGVGSSGAAGGGSYSGKADDDDTTNVVEPIMGEGSLPEDERVGEGPDKEEDSSTFAAEEIPSVGLVAVQSGSCVPAAVCDGRAQDLSQDNEQEAGATAKSAAAAAAAEVALIPPIVPVPPVYSAALSSKMEELTFGDGAGVEPEVNREGPLPSTRVPIPASSLAAGVRRPGPFRLGDLGARIFRGVTGGTGTGTGTGTGGISGGSGGGGRPFEERTPVWTGEEGEQNENIAVARETEAGASTMLDAPRNLTPPPWGGSGDIGDHRAAAPSGGGGDDESSPPASVVNNGVVGATAAVATSEDVKESYTSSPGTQVLAKQSEADVRGARDNAVEGKFDGDLPSGMDSREASSNSGDGVAEVVPEKDAAINLHVGSGGGGGGGDAATGVTISAGTTGGSDFDSSLVFGKTAAASPSLLPSVSTEGMESSGAAQGDGKPVVMTLSPSNGSGSEGVEGTLSVSSLAELLPGLDGVAHPHSSSAGSDHSDSEVVAGSA